MIIGTDLFISYSSKDKDFAEKLAKDLSSCGLKVWFDKWKMMVGDSLHNKIEDGITNSAWLAVVLSPSSVSSPWVKKELNSALMKELEQKQVCVLPLLYQKCNIPLFLQDKIYADFSSEYEHGLADLMAVLKPPIRPDLLGGLMSESRLLISNSWAKIGEQDRELYSNELVMKLASLQSGERLASLTGLFVTRHKNLSAHLLRMASDTSDSVRRLAVFYLGEMRAKNAIGVVSERLSDKNPMVRDAARGAYRKISGR